MRQLLPVVNSLKSPISAKRACFHQYHEDRRQYCSFCCICLSFCCSFNKRCLPCTSKFIAQAGAPKPSAHRIACSGCSMIDYKHGAWGMGVLFMKRGSVIPKALVWSLPCATITVLLHIFWVTQKGDNNAEMEGINTIWSGYTFVLGFLIVFRSNQAYSRFWESVTLFHQITGEWTSAVSNLLSFCSPNIEKQKEVEDFRQYLIRLLSLLHCNALQTICDLADDTLEVLNLGGIDAASLLHLRTSPDRCEIVLLWIERLIIEADRKKTLEVSPPILSRAFQELSRGMVSVTDVRKIRKVPFPFPYSQYLSYMLILHWILTPLVASQTVLKPWWAGIIVPGPHTDSTAFLSMMGQSSLSLDKKPTNNLRAHTDKHTRRLSAFS